MASFAKFSLFCKQIYSYAFGASRFQSKTRWVRTPLTFSICGHHLLPVRTNKGRPYESVKKILPPTCGHYTTILALKMRPRVRWTFSWPSFQRFRLSVQWDLRLFFWAEIGY